METNSKRRGTNSELVQVLYLYNVLVSVSYFMTQQPLLFQIAFGALTVLLIARAVHLVKTIPDCSSYLLWYGVSVYVIAFVLWNIDNLCCEQLRWIRDSLPWFLSGLFELHAWWHVLVGIACHSQIQFSCHLRNTFLKRRCTIWTWYGFLPFVKVHDDDQPATDTAISSSPRDSDAVHGNRRN